MYVWRAYQTSYGFTYSKRFLQRFVLRVRIYSLVRSTSSYIICIDSMQEKELEGVSEGGSSRHQSPAGQASITS